MENVFLHLVNMSITAGWLVLAVVVLRLVFRRAPKWVHCLLWVLVGVRLVCPFSIESVLSLIPSAETVPVDTFLYETPSIHSGVPVVDNVVNPVISDSFAPQPMNSVNPMQVLSILAAYAWVLGMALMLIYAVVATLRLKWRVRESVQLQRNIYQCDRIATPFILGVIRPRIYLPTTLSEGDILSVVAHEEAHIRRRDHWWKPLGFLLLTVYWFNPLLWLGYVLLCRDIEAACDQRVIRDMDVAQRKAYSETLLACSAPRHLITACPLAFGETGVKSRIKAVLNYKKPAFWLIIVAVVAVAVAAVCLLTDPKTTVSDELDAYLTQVILDKNQGDHTGDAYPTEAHTVFGVEEKDGKTVVYTMVLYEEYYLDNNGALQVQSGSHIPTAITVDMEGNGYSLVEYWIPGDGTQYLPDMKEKFPFFYRIQVDTAKYYDIHHPQTLAAAEEHFGADAPDGQKEPTKNYWQTFSHPLHYTEAVKVTGGYQLQQYDIERLEKILNEVEWKFGPAQDAEFLCDAYFCLDGKTRYYVYMDTLAGYSYLAIDQNKHAPLTEDQANTVEGLVCGGVTSKATHYLSGNYSEWNKAEWYFVLDVVQADDTALVGKKIRVNYKNTLGRGAPHIGTMLEVAYDGVVVHNDMVYAINWYEQDKDVTNPTTDVVNTGAFTGKVIHVANGSVLMNCYDKNEFDTVWVNFGDAYPNLKPKMGEEYTVSYDGMVMETYPPQVVAEEMLAVSSTPLKSDFISEERAIEIAVDHWRVQLGEPDRETGYYTTVYVMESPTADNPRYKMGSRRVDTQDGAPGNSALYNTIYIDAVTGEISSATDVTEPTVPTTSRAPTTTTTTTSKTTQKPTASTKPPVSADGGFSGWRGDTFIVSDYLGVHKDGDKHWSVLAVQSVEEMNDLFEEYNFDQKDTMIKTYNSAYFEQNILLLVHYTHSTCNVEPRVVDVRYGDDKNSLRVWLDVYEPYMQSDAFGSWLLATSVDRAAAANITSYDAYVRGSVLLSYYVAPYENAPTLHNIKSAPESWRDNLGEESFELDKILNPLNWSDLGTKANGCTFVGSFNLHGINYYVSSDYTLICTEQQVASLTKKDGDYFRALFQPRDDLRYLSPYWTQLSDTIQNSAHKPAKRNCWHTLSQPMLRSEAAEITGGYTLEENDVKKLKAIVDEVDWEVEPEQYFDSLFDAYFSFNGSSRYYVYRNAAKGSFITNGMGYYAMLTKEQCKIIERLMSGGV